MQKRRAFITGIAGQDGAYLARELLRNGYDVHGLARNRVKTENLDRLGVKSHVHVHNGDLSDSALLRKLLIDIRPSHVFNLAAVSSLAQADIDPMRTWTVNADAPRAMFEAAFRIDPDVRIVQASSALVFAPNSSDAINEGSLKAPEGIYARTKASVDRLFSRLREQGAHCSNLYLFNHESPLRADHFVTRKIVKALVKLNTHEDASPLQLGDITSIRDWSFAGDFARAMRLASEAEEPGEYVLASGLGNSVKQFVEAVCDELGIQFDWDVKPDQILGLDAKTSRVLIVAKLPAVIHRVSDIRIGDPEKAKRRLDWSPSVSFGRLVQHMVKYEGSDVVTPL